MLGTGVGTMFGVWLGLHYDRLQAAAAKADDTRRRAAARRERLKIVTANLRDELVHNGTGILQLQDALEKTPSARSDVWALARIVVDSFEFEAYREWTFVPSTGAAADDPIALAYRNIRRLKQEVRQGEAAHAVLLGYSADQTSADKLRDGARQSASIIHLQIEQALESLGPEPRLLAN